MNYHIKKEHCLNIYGFKNKTFLVKLVSKREVVIKSAVAYAVNNHAKDTDIYSLIAWDLEGEPFNKIKFPGDSHYQLMWGNTDFFGVKLADIGHLSVNPTHTDMLE